MNPLRRAQLKATTEFVVLSSALTPATLDDAALTVAEIDAELLAIHHELKTLPDDHAVRPRLHEDADAWLDKRLHLEPPSAPDGVTL